MTANWDKLSIFYTCSKFRWSLLQVWFANNAFIKQHLSQVKNIQIHKIVITQIEQFEIDMKKNHIQYSLLTKGWSVQMMRLFLFLLLSLFAAMILMLSHIAETKHNNLVEYSLQQTPYINKTIGIFIIRKLHKLVHQCFWDIIRMSQIDTHEINSWQFWLCAKLNNIAQYQQVEATKNRVC